MNTGVELVQSNPKVLGGMPVIRGTRIPVARILALVGMDYGVTDLRHEYPQLQWLTRKDVFEILAYYQGRLVSSK